MDEYAEAVAEEAFRALLVARDELPNPIRKLGLTGMPGDIHASFVVVQGDGARMYHEFELAGPDTAIPVHIDDTEDDAVLAGFYERHGIDQDDAVDDATPSWGDAYALPAVVLIHELVEAANRLGQRLREAGLPVADDCGCYAGDHDSYWGRWDGFADRARDAVRALPEAQRHDIAAMCYASPERRLWLTTP
jgi:hypothetical protein